MTSVPMTDALVSDIPSIEKEIPAGYAAQTEGKATILQKGNEVFYNPAQINNRDLSIAVINYFGQVRRREAEARKAQGLKRTAGGSRRTRSDGMHILEGLAASGLRSIRYAKEIDGVDKVVANDLDPSVVDAMRRNIEFNGPEVAAKVVPSVGDARIVMMQNPSSFDVVDLDPYGSPSQLLDAAVQAIDDGGLLLVTATDMAVLCGNNGEACFAKYGSYPLHKPYCHEMAVRIVLSSISSAAARHKRYIVPMLSLSIDFYVRIFVRVYTSAAETKNAATKIGYVYQSQGCHSFYWQRVGRKILKGDSVKYAPGSAPAVPQQCPHTGANFTMGGPFWAEALHDPEWVRGVLGVLRDRRSDFRAFDKLQGLLTSCAEELPDVPLYMDIHEACKTLKCTSPRTEIFRSALINAGYRVSGTHCTPLGIKTDAPWEAIWDILRCWVKDHPVKIKPGTAAETILSKEPELKADFSRAPNAVQYGKKGKNKVARFMPNPQANWGPRMKHGKTAKVMPWDKKKEEEGTGAPEEGNGEQNVLVENSNGATEMETIEGTAVVDEEANGAAAAAAAGPSTGGASG